MLLIEYRQSGIAEATVSVVAEFILERGILPYYVTVVSNIASRRTALSTGYRLTWVELYSKKIKRDGNAGDRSGEGN